MTIGLEVPVFGPAGALKAIELGASRIELNATGSYPDGGLTPELADLHKISHLDMPLRVMIRPRGPPKVTKDFIYTPREIDQMQDSIRVFKESGALKVERGDGFVFGVLKEDTILVEPMGSETLEADSTRFGLLASRRVHRCLVDKEACTGLIEAARPFKVVFHRAYDEIVSRNDSDSTPSHPPSWESGLQDLSACGFDGVLTSGGQGNAAQNITALQNIIPRAGSLGVEVIVGGGVRQANVSDLVEQLNLGPRHSTYVHSACLTSTSKEEPDHGEIEGIIAKLKDIQEKD
ncbi:hypothetical protein F5Y15DRAFT_36800 [Xylariaceae sp. FL0016]|nr:hypothetical protein F5Y15DRAFT_36800 [Xylariaceae sp. FL0016]